MCLGMCDAGTFSTAVAQTNGSLCRSCIASQIAPAGSSSCQNCSMGYMPVYGNGECEREKPTLCPPGQRALDTKRCGNCSAGRSAATEAARYECTPCGFGFVAPVTGLTACAMCPTDTVTGVVDNSTACRPCLPGKVQDDLAMFCVACGTGTMKVRSVVGDVECMPCPRGSVALAGSTNCTKCMDGQFADASRAACTRCGAKTYHPYPEDAACTSCPLIGTDCSNSQITILPEYWLPPPPNSTRYRIKSDTVLYRCLYHEACLEPQPGDLFVKCDASKGYRGVICGDCSRKAGYIRTGVLCSECFHISVSVSLSLGLLGVSFLSIVYYVCVMSFDAVDPKDTTSVAFKMLMSYNQMLSILGIFKARGTAFFRKIVRWPTSIAGGGVTKALFVKCALNSALYFPFVLSMLTPIAALLTTCLVLVVKTLWERKQEARRQLEGIDVEPPAARPRCMPVSMMGGCVERLLIHGALCWPRVALTPAEEAEWRANKAAEREKTFSPTLRLASVTVFVLFSMYPTLIQSSVGVLRCSESIDGRRYVIDDYAKECYTPEHFFFFVSGIIFLALYALGIPLVAQILIWKYRNEIAANDPRAMGSLGFLFAGYSTTRGGCVMSWEVLIMVRKLCIVVLGIIDLSGTVQVLCAILLLLASLLLTINVRPYTTQWMNLLEEGSTCILIVTQTLSLVYLDIDAKAATAAQRKSEAHNVAEVGITVLLMVFNGIAFIALGAALFISVLRQYGPKVGCCLEGRACDSVAVKVLDEEWIKGDFVPRGVKLVWRKSGGEVVEAPMGVVVKWRHVKTGAFTEQIKSRGAIMPPPLGHDLAYFDAAGADFVITDVKPVWCDTKTGKVIALTGKTRTRTQWMNTRTYRISLVDPTGGAARAAQGAAAPAAAPAVGAAVAPGPAAVPATASASPALRLQITDGTVEGEGGDAGGAQDAEGAADAELEPSREPQLDLEEGSGHAFASPIPPPLPPRGSRHSVESLPASHRAARRSTHEVENPLNSLDGIDGIELGDFVRRPPGPASKI